MKWQYFPSVDIKAPLHQWDMSHYGLVLDLAKMYDARSRARLPAKTATTSATLTSTITTTTITTVWPLLILLLVNQVASMSLDRLALERNELPAPEPTAASAVVVDDMKMAAVPANGNTDMYMLVPESMASQLDDTEHVHRNTIDGESESEALPDSVVAGESADMLMLESDDTPAMQMVELPSDISMAEEAQTEQHAYFQSESEPEAAVASPEIIEEHVVEHPVEGVEQSAEQLQPLAIQQPLSQEVQLENADNVVETATEGPQVVANEEQQQEIQADDEVAEVPAETDAEEKHDIPAAYEESLITIQADPEQVQQQEAELPLQPDSQSKPEEEASPVETEKQIAEEESKSEIETNEVPAENAAAENDVDTTEASVLQSMAEGIEEGLSAVMSDLLPEETKTPEAEEAQNNHQPEADVQQVVQQEDAPADPEELPTEIETQTAVPEIEVETATEQRLQDEPISADNEATSPVQDDPAEEPLAEAQTEQSMPVKSEPEPQPETHPETETIAEVQPESEAQPKAEAQPEPEAQPEVQVQPEPEDAQPEAEVQPEAVTQPEPEAQPEAADKDVLHDAEHVSSEVLSSPVQNVEVAIVPAAASEPEVIKETEPIEKEPEVIQPLAEQIMADETPDVPEILAEPKPEPEKQPEQSMLTTIIPLVVPQMPTNAQESEPIQVLDSVLNYVNASFMQQEQDMHKTELDESVPESPFNANLRRYDGAQVWRIVVQTDKDKKLADELQSKFDGQLWKEVKQEVDYLLKPQVLAAAERHIRAANLSRIVLIDNLQQVIEVENPPAEKIAELQNRKGHRLTWQAYHRLEDIHGFIDYMAKTYPDICSTEIIGYSVEKRPLKILKISNGNPRNPGIWIDGGMHAREWISPSTVTYIANQLIEGWEDLPKHMTEVNWFIHPMANPDGYEYSHTTDRLWRKNMRAHGRQCPGVDLNRNFGYKWGGKGTSASPCSQTYRGSKAFSEPETFYISKFISGFPRETFQAYLSFHSYGQYILYPWGYDYHLTKDRADLDRVARQAGTIITKTSGVKYTVGSSATTLYPAAGGSDDWAKGIAGIKYAYTVEMGDTGRYGFVLPAHFIQNNGKDGYTFADTVARAVTQGRGNDGRSNSNRRRLH